jgi:ABC-2 type transport system permease protein/sodium transport system permease protein
LILNTVITALLFGLLPLTYCNYQKIDIRTTFRMVWPSGKFSMIVIFFSVLLGTSLWMAAHELFLLGRALGIETLSDEQVQAAKSLIAQFRQVSPWLVLFSFALTPAVFEEFFFRGFVLSSLHQMSRSGAILVSASLFGLFHVIVGSTLSIERFLPTTLMGLFLGWLAFRTQSLWPGVFLHATHNGLLLLTAYYTETLKDWGIGLEEQSHLPWTWLIVGVVITLMSLTAIELISRLSPRSAQV